MNRPWQVWLVFAVCVLGAVGAMSWLTRQAFEADRLRRTAEARTELEQRVSLALWRMDTELAPIVAEEVIRPVADYRRTNGGSSLPGYVLLQFEARPDGSWVSPQAALTKGSDLGQLSKLRRSVDYAELAKQLPQIAMPSINQQRQEVAQQVELPSDDPFGNNANGQVYFEGNNFGLPPNSSPEQQQQSGAAVEPSSNANPSAKSPAADLQQRGARYQSAARQSLMNRQSFANSPAIALPEELRSAVPVGVSVPIWVGDRLLLARRVGANGQSTVQGCWLDWPTLKGRLLGEANDLLPNADLVPVTTAAAADPSRMLAGLPVRLVVGYPKLSNDANSALRWSVWMSWGAVMLTVGASAVLLYGVMALSERRAAFVSSVTHELRTPLTTFRMYAGMLAKGMVPDAARRQEYFETLQKESERLTLLVENVLAYARLERGRGPQASDHITLSSLFDRIGPRLKQRAEQSSMQCEVRLDTTSADQEFVTDQTVVEQILFNLVDNAAKYARNATDRQIHIDASCVGHEMRIVVRDHGPGISRIGTSHAMQPFEKSAQESAETAPGVGLGLALCRRLARQLRGRLEIADANGGAQVTLRLPV